jgi:hypothetical protein
MDAPGILHKRKPGLLLDPEHVALVDGLPLAALLPIHPAGGGRFAQKLMGDAARTSLLIINPSAVEARRRPR